MNQIEGKVLLVRGAQALHGTWKRESWDWTRGSRNRVSEKSVFLCMINESSDSYVGIESIVALCMHEWHKIPPTEKTMRASTVNVIWTSGNHRGDLTRPIKDWNFNAFFKVTYSDSWSLLNFE